MAKNYNPNEPMSPTNLPKPWTVRQYLFVKAYIGEANCIASKAAEIAGYSKSSSYEIGSQFLRKLQYKHVQDYIKDELGALVQRFDVSKEGLMKRLEEISNASIADVVEVHNGRIRLKPFDEMPHHALGAIKSITDKSGNTDEIGVALHDPQTAIKELARIQKIYEDMNTTNVGEVHIYIPDNGRDDPANRDRVKIKESEVPKKEDD